MPLHYSLAPNLLRVDREVLEREFLSVAELEGVADVEELDRVLTKAVTLRNMLKSEDRVDRVAAYVAGHFRQHVEPSGYKAFLVGVDREACCLYKAALDRYLPTEYSTVVISPGHNDPAHIVRYHLSGEAEQQVRKAFRRPNDQPQILIVTEKLLTGFDAPILQMMYLDKPMRDHVLLQAIARVNRPYEDQESRRKTSGIILDFVGIFERLEAALAFDSEDVTGVIQGIDVLQRSWQRLMTRAREEYLPIAAGRVADKAVEVVLEHFRDREIRDIFYKFFRELEELYEILSPDAFLRDYMYEFGDLSAMYRLLRVSFEPNIDIDRSFLRKTADLVRQQTSSGRIIDPAKVYVLDQGVIEVLADPNKPDTVKVFNLTKVLAQEVERKQAQQPYLVPIGERAEAVVRQFEDRQLSTQDALDELTKLLGEVDNAEQMRQSSNLGLEAFAIFWMLNRMQLPGTESIATAMDQEFSDNPYWRQSPEQERRVRLKFYSTLIASGVDQAKLIEIVDSVLNVLKREL